MNCLVIGPELIAYEMIILSLGHGVGQMIVEGQIMECFIKIEFALFFQNRFPNYSVNSSPGIQIPHVFGQFLVM